MVGVNEQGVTAQVVGGASNNNAAIARSVGIGLDSTSANATGVLRMNGAGEAAATMPLFATLTTYPGVGRHVLVWLEWSAATATTTWIGDQGDGADRQSGISGLIEG